MSDFLFKLESHLTPPQRDVVAMVEAAAGASDEPIFLVGGAMRDMLGGFLITDLDFSVQGDTAPLLHHLMKKHHASVADKDPQRNTTELVFPNGVTAEVGMSRTERYPRLGGPPVVKPAPIHDDLLRRDFTMNSIALSLYPASRGLLLDPTNGQADIERRELRANNNQCFYDDPSRLLRLQRFRIRFGFEVDPRTARQYENAREAEVEKRISSRTLFREFRALAGETKLVDTVTAFEKEGLLTVFSPAFHGPKLNGAGLGKLEKARQMIPFGANLTMETLGLFMLTLTEKLTPAEKAVLTKNLGIRKKEAELWQNLASRSKKLESDLQSKKLRGASDIYLRLKGEPGETILFLYLHSRERIVHDRIRNFLQKYLFVALEVTDREVTTLTGMEPSAPGFESLKKDMITARLDGRKWEPPPPPPPPETARPPTGEVPAESPALRKRAIRKTAVAAAAPAKEAKKHSAEKPPVPAPPAVPEEPKKAVAPKSGKAPAKQTKAAAKRKQAVAPATKAVKSAKAAAKPAAKAKKTAMKPETPSAKPKKTAAKAKQAPAKPKKTAAAKKAGAGESRASGSRG